MASASDIQLHYGPDFARRRFMEIVELGDTSLHDAVIGQLALVSMHCDVGALVTHALGRRRAPEGARVRLGRDIALIASATGGQFNFAGMGAGHLPTGVSSIDT